MKRYKSTINGFIEVENGNLVFYNEAELEFTNKNNEIKELKEELAHGILEATAIACNRASLAEKRVEELEIDLGAMTFKAKAFKTLAERLEIKVSERDKRVEELEAERGHILYAEAYQDSRAEKAESDLAAARAEIERMREAFIPLLNCHDEDEGMDDLDDSESVGSETNDLGEIVDMKLTFGILRKARAALAPSAPSEVKP